MEVLHFVAELYYTNGTMQKYDCFRIIPIDCECGEEPFCFQFDSNYPCLISPKQPAFDTKEQCEAGLKVLKRTKKLKSTTLLPPIENGNHTFEFVGKTYINVYWELHFCFFLIWIEWQFSTIDMDGFWTYHYLADIWRFCFFNNEKASNISTRTE